MRGNPKTPGLLFGVTLVVSIFMLAPIGLSVMAGLVNNYSAGIKSGLTLRWFMQVLDGYGNTISWSLLLG